MSNSSSQPCESLNLFPAGIADFLSTQTILKTYLLIKKIPKNILEVFFNFLYLQKKLKKTFNRLQKK
jgi:hypothetical protein